MPRAVKKEKTSRKPKKASFNKQVINVLDMLASRTVGVDVAIAQLKTDYGEEETEQPEEEEETTEETPA